MKVAAFYDAWLAGASGGNLVGPMAARTRRHFPRRIVAQLGDLELDQVTPADLWRCQRAWLADGLAVATVNLLTHTVVRSLLRDAAASGHVWLSALASLFPAVHPVPGEGERTRHPMTLAERDRLLDVIRTGPRPWGLPLAAWLFATGMRPGEACGLLWEDVDLERRVCRILRSRYEAVVTTANTAGSRRTIPLARAAVAALAGLKRRQATDYIFTGARGTRPILSENYSKWIWRPSCRTAGLAGYPLYSTRHSFISWQISNGKTPAAVARYWCTSVKIILAHYYEYTEDFRHEEWDAALGAAPLRPVTRLRARKP